MDNIKEQVLSVLAETLDVEAGELEMDKKLYDSVGVDSTEIIEVNVKLEKKFGVKILEDEISKDSTPSEIISVIEKKLSSAN